jgi:hypothetical protein
MRPGIGVSPRHQRRSITGTLLAARDPGPDKQVSGHQHRLRKRKVPLIGEVFATTIGVWEMGISTIDDDVTFGLTLGIEGLGKSSTLLEMGEQGFDKVVDGGPCFDEEHDATGTF